MSYYLKISFIIYFKNVKIKIKKKYIDDRSERKHKKLEVSILKNAILSDVSKNTRNY